MKILQLIKKKFLDQKKAIEQIKGFQTLFINDDTTALEVIRQIRKHNVKIITNNCASILTVTELSL